MMSWWQMPHFLTLFVIFFTFIFFCRGPSPIKARFIFSSFSWDFPTPPFFCLLFPRRRDEWQTESSIILFRYRRRRRRSFRRSLSKWNGICQRKLKIIRCDSHSPALSDGGWGKLFLLSPSFCHVFICHRWDIVSAGGKSMKGFKLKLQIGSQAGKMPWLSPNRREKIETCHFYSVWNCHEKERWQRWF